MGINKYATPGNNLRGCVADVQDMYNLLTNVYHLKQKNIRVLTDQRATKNAIISNLQWLIDSSSKNDEAIYYHSGHGTQIRDVNGDELTDQLDECLVTYDFNWHDALTDDVIHNLFKKLKRGAFLSMVCDTCHSGSMTRGFAHPGYNRTPKTITPPFDIQCRMDDRLSVNHMGRSDKKPDTQRHILLSGCQDNQFSQEALIGGQIRGALTYFLTSHLRSNRGSNWAQLHLAVCKALNKNGYTQRPNLAGSNNLVNRTLFGGADRKE